MSLSKLGYEKSVVFVLETFSWSSFCSCWGKSAAMLWADLWRDLVERNWGRPPTNSRWAICALSPRVWVELNPSSHPIGQYGRRFSSLASLHVTLQFRTTAGLECHESPWLRSAQLNCTRNSDPQTLWDIHFCCSRCKFWSTFLHSRR